MYALYSGSEMSAAPGRVRLYEQIKAYRDLGGVHVWHAGVSKTHWQPARSVAHAHNSGVAVYGSPESREYCGPRRFTVYEGVDRRARGRRYAT